MAKVTPWFPRTVPPVHFGWYDVKVLGSRRVERMLYAAGIWSSGLGIVTYRYDVLQWRGSTVRLT